MAVSVTATAAPATPALWPGAFRVINSDVLPDGSWQMIADASDASARCQFNIRIKLVNNPFLAWFSSSKVTFSRRPGSDCRRFLDVIVGTLNFTGALPKPEPSQSLVTNIKVLGNQLVRSGGQEFVFAAVGTWMAAKLALGTGNEVFLNIDESHGVGEFAIKDQGHAFDIVSEFARVFSPATPSAN